MTKKIEIRYKRAAHFNNTIQQERAYQAQKGVNENIHGTKKHVALSGARRWTKTAGLGFKTPKEASQGIYIDKKCPFTGDVAIRGRMMRGTVVSTKMKNTIVIRRNYLHFANKYQRYMKCHKNFAIHCSPCFAPHKGDEVIVGQCRPLSKTVRYNVMQVIQKTGKAGKKFSKH